MFFFEAASGRSEAKVATKLSIVPISMVSRFVFFLLFQASSGRSQAKVATKSPIVPISNILHFAFFYFIRTILWHLQQFFYLNAYFWSVGGAWVPFLHGPGRMTKTKNFLEEMAENFRPTWFFCRNILKFDNLPTAFINSDKLLPVTHWSNDLLPGRDSHPKIWLTMNHFFLAAENFSLPKNWRKNREKMNFQRASGTFY